jgi:hypothetical protein
VDVGGITKTPDNRGDLDQQESMRVPEDDVRISEHNRVQDAGTMHISMRRSGLEVVECGEASMCNNTDSTVLEVRGCGGT